MKENVPKRIFKEMNLDASQTKMLSFLKFLLSSAPRTLSSLYNLTFKTSPASPNFPDSHPADIYHVPAPDSD